MIFNCGLDFFEPVSGFKEKPEADESGG